MKKGWMKRRIAALLALLTALCVYITGAQPLLMAAHASELGESIDWTLIDGVLTITGDGKMKDQNFYYNDLYDWHHTYIHTVIMSEGITEIGEYSFGDFADLRTVQIPSTVYRIRAQAFVDCQRLELSVLPDAVRDIGHWAFENCDSLTDFVISPQVAALGNGVFRYCDRLENVVFTPSLVAVPYEAFSGCMNLSNITIGSGIETISGYAFSNCYSLNSIAIPSVKHIEKYAFFGSGLQSIYLDSIEKIEYNAFSECVGLTDIYYGGSEADWSKVSIEETGNEPLLNATVHFNSPMPDSEEDTGEAVGAPAEPPAEPPEEATDGDNGSDNGESSVSDTGDDAEDADSDAEDSEDNEAVVTIGDVEIPSKLMVLIIISAAALIFSLIAATIAHSSAQQAAAYSPSYGQGGMSVPLKVLVLAVYLAVGSAVIYLILTYLI